MRHARDRSSVASSLLRRALCAGALLLVALAAVPAARASGDADAAPKIDDVIKRAKDAGKPLLLEFSAAWCGPCKQFAAEVLPRPDVQQALGEVIFVQYDAEVGNGIDAAARFGVSAYPSFLIVDGEAKERNRQMGSIPAPMFIAFVQQAATDVLSEPDLKKRLAAHPDDLSTLLVTARWYRGHGKVADAKRYYEQIVKADPAGAKGFGADAAWECQELERYWNTRKAIVRDAVRFAGRFPKSDRAIDQFQLAAFSGDVPAAQLQELASKMAAALPDDPDTLNSAVYAFLAAGTLDAALDAAEHQVRLLPNDANPYDSLAEVYHLRGEQDRALANSKKSLELVKDPMLKKALEENLARFTAGGKKPPDGLDAQRGATVAMLAGLPGKDPSVAKPSAASDPRMQEAIRYRAEMTQALTTSGKTCAEKAGKLEEIYVRVHFAKGTTKPSSVDVLEPKAPLALKKCLGRELAKQTYSSALWKAKDKFTGAVPIPTAKAAAAAH